MVDVVLLKDEVSKTGIPIAEICRRTGMLRETFYNRLNEPSKFTAEEIAQLSKVCKWTGATRNKIFFA